MCMSMYLWRKKTKQANRKLSEQPEQEKSVNGNDCGHGARGLNGKGRDEGTRAGTMCHVSFGVVLWWLRLEEP